ncbi:MAG: hypothetical protein Kow00105_01690 [Phycisphaeraceae bacterium]
MAEISQPFTNIEEAASTAITALISQRKQNQEKTDSYADYPPEEIFAGAITPQSSDRINLQVTTNRGQYTARNVLAKFVPTQRGIQDEQSDDTILDYWDFLSGRVGDSKYNPNTFSQTTAADLIDQLAGSSEPSQRELVIEIEALPIDQEDRPRLIELLKDYILHFRDSKERENLIAVSAAIRKCVALMDLADMGWLSELLESGHRVQPSLDTELEIAKMVFRRYSQSPPDRPDPHPKLSEQLAEMASDYLRPRVFNRDRFSTVAMLAMQALLVMRSKHSPNIIDQLNKLPYRWFRHQLHRRMRKVLQQLPADAPGIDKLQNLTDGIRLD